VLGKAFIDNFPMGVAERHRGRIGSDAVPNQLHKTKTLLDWELQDFRYIGLTHMANLPPFTDAR
jgi:hypothetical protein